MLLPKKIHPSWEMFLSDDIKKEVLRIEQSIGEDFNPTDREKVLRFLNVDLDRVRVIWLGQDVYPAKGVATGRAFEVGNLDSWLQPFRQVSLKNIIRLIHKNYFGIQTYEEIASYTEIKKQIKNGEFPILPPHDWFSSLESQGVLFLNTSFTCRIGVPNSHKAVWAHFSHKVLEYISMRRPDIIWFLWGREAQSNIPYIREGKLMKSRHPSRVSKDYPDDFLKFTGFEQTSNFINWLGK